MKRVCSHCHGKCRVDDESHSHDNDRQGGNDGDDVALAHCPSSWGGVLCIIHILAEVRC